MRSHFATICKLLVSEPQSARKPRELGVLRRGSAREPRAQGTERSPSGEGKEARGTESAPEGSSQWREEIPGGKGDKRAAGAP